VFTLVVKVSPSQPSGSTITNTATVGSSTTDLNGANNSGGATTTVSTAADLVLTKNCDAGAPLPGQSYGCTVTVTNNGPSDAQSLTMSDLSNNTTLVGTPSGAGWTCGAGNPFTCTRPTLPAGQTDTINYTVRVNDNAGPAASLNNTATISSSTPDPGPGANSTTVTKSSVACTIDMRGATSAQAITGTAGPDVICGSPYADSIKGLGGDDLIFGGDGDDYIDGGTGNDTIYAGNGKDYVLGSDGNDSIRGDDADDYLNGGAGTDTIDGGPGADYCAGESLTNCSP
jgi:uncharacterized repeat protein (TIGR01451 family)